MSFSMANNVLRAYVGTISPSKQFIDLTTYIMKIYANYENFDCPKAKRQYKHSKIFHSKVKF